MMLLKLSAEEEGKIEKENIQEDMRTGLVF